MPLDLFPALLLIVVIAAIVAIAVVAVVRVRRRTVAGQAPRSAATTTQPIRGLAGRVSRVVDQSIGMTLVRRVRGTYGASDGAVDDRQVPTAPRAAPPTRLTTVGGPRRVPLGSSRTSQPTPPDPRVRLWRDTSIVAVAFGLVAIVGANVFRPNVDGGVLGQISPTTGVPGANATAIALPPTPPAESQAPAPSDHAQSPDPALAPAASRAPLPARTARPAPAPTGLPAPTPTPDPTAGPTPPPSPTPEATADPTPPPSPEPTPDPTPVPTPTPDPTPDPTPSPTPVP
ncbi:MAG: hypothetical protein AABZ33_00825 [Chloroflexota bacterium]